MKFATIRLLSTLKLIIDSSVLSNTSLKLFKLWMMFQHVFCQNVLLVEEKLFRLEMNFNSTHFTRYLTLQKTVGMFEKYFVRIKFLQSAQRFLMCNRKNFESTRFFLIFQNKPFCDAKISSRISNNSEFFFKEGKTRPVNLKICSAEPTKTLALNSERKTQTQFSLKTLSLIVPNPRKILNFKICKFHGYFFLFSPRRKMPKTFALSQSTLKLLHQFMFKTKWDDV